MDEQPERPTLPMPIPNDIPLVEYIPCFDSGNVFAVSAARALNSNNIKKPNRGMAKR